MQNNRSHKTCWLCSDALTEENFTREHIIPNSIGGRKKADGFICSTCNSKRGEDWDAVLSEQFLWFSLATGIKRERGDTPDLSVETAAGEKLLLRSDGTMTVAKPTYVEQEKEDGKIQINMQVRTEREAKRMLGGVARKFPSADVKSAAEKLVVERSYLDSPLTMSLVFGGPKGGRSMVKTALALASECGIEKNQCEKAINYLKDADASPPFGFCYSVDLVRNRPQGQIFHCVALRGLPERRKLLAYVEYFNWARILIELSDVYDGEDVHRTYAVDPTSGLEVDIQIDFDVDSAFLNAAIQGDGMPLEKYIEAVNGVLPVVLARSFDRERNRAVIEAVKFAFEKLGVKPGEACPPEHFQEFSRLVEERLEPFLTAYKQSNLIDRSASH